MLSFLISSSAKSFVLNKNTKIFLFTFFQVELFFKKILLALVMRSLINNNLIYSLNQFIF